MTATKPGSVYLAASSHEGTLREMASRILASKSHRPRPLRVAATYAAAGGPLVERMSHSIAHLFEGAAIERFTVAGEKDPMPPAHAASIVANADVVFVGGGDPVEGARRLVSARADAWLRDARARGTPCLGISAGAIMLSAFWAEWPDHPPHGAPHDGGALVECTRVVPDLVVDCHAEDDDWSELRLVAAMARERRGTAPQPRFLGLPTGRGIVIDPEGTIATVGGAPFQLSL
jgi:cyanophycinase-like exopeptidase